ncbi:hypothetical protein V8G54_022125 [Vigna mungo]|uniref:Integrase catalytic domain-containing protein n=1 Tax=Vigna mungo TaxID=3915 RepID=A0AAQ3RY06_VIGMU
MRQARMVDLSTLHYPILTDKNWSRWSTQMRVVFRVQGVSNVIEGGEVMVDSSGKEEQKKEFRQKDDKALLIIHQCVDDTHFEKIQNAASTREAWNILVRCHFGGEKVKKVRLQTLRRQYEHTEMEDGDKVSEFFIRVLIVANQMKTCGEKISDVMIMEKIMRLMPAAFDHIVVAIEESRDMEKLKIEELQSAFETYEMRRNGRKKRDDQALKIQHVFGEGKKKSSKWKGNNNQKNWKKDTNDQEDKSDSADKKDVAKKHYSKKDKKNIECFVCHKKGHFSYECCFNKEVQNKKGKNREAHLVEEESYSKPLILMVATNTERTEAAQNIWYVDSGCSNHMTYNRSWLTNLDESKKSKVRVTDNSTLKVEGIGSVKIKRKSGLHATLENVLLVPEMKCNLLSVGQLTKNGYTVIMGSNTQMEVYDQGKLAKRPFRKQLESRSKERLEVIHSDVCGPIEPPTVAGKSYFVTFVDEFSRMKSEVSEIFKQFKKHTEREIERRIKLLRTDGGGEYTSRDFEAFCQDNGIIHEVTIAYTPEHNGLAKRHNRTIMNMAGCMLKEKSVARELWEEAVATVVYVLNRCLTKHLPGSKKTSIKHFKTFGSLAFNHVADQKRVKLDDKGEPMVFMGYHPTRAYKLFDPIRKRMTTNRDVILIEDENWDWKHNQTSMKKVNTNTLMHLPVSIEAQSYLVEVKSCLNIVQRVLPSTNEPEAGNLHFPSTKEPEDDHLANSKRTAPTIGTRNASFSYSRDQGKHLN